MPRFHFEIKRHPLLIDLLYASRFCILCAGCPISFIPFDAFGFAVWPFVEAVDPCVCVCEGVWEWRVASVGHIRWFVWPNFCVCLCIKQKQFSHFCVTLFFSDWGWCSTKLLKGIGGATNGRESRTIFFPCLDHHRHCHSLPFFLMQYTHKSASEKRHAEIVILRRSASAHLFVCPRTRIPCMRIEENQAQPV